MYVKVNKYTLAIKSVSETIPRSDEEHIIIYNPNIKTTNIEYIRAYRDESGNIIVEELPDEQKQKIEQAKFVQYKDVLKRELNNKAKQYILSV